ncbi:hypothetical protein GCM10009430_25660 [Aquimarina litoralis]|uniref:CHAP domain-containing protein n=1 Tax=Aquimarina litoralis TaxID=584605 RepID=A0ABN1IWV1_9FLAO
MGIFLSTYVPELGMSPDSEICHTFVYRWLIANGNFTGDYPDPLQNISSVEAERFFFPDMGLPARVGGEVQVRENSVIGFWDHGGVLQHTMLAITPTSWVGANNTGCFGVQGGRTQINDVDEFVNGPRSHFGWVGDDNGWQGQYQGLTVTYRDLPRRTF